MFSQISWQQYFAYVAVTGLLYYIAVVALYYRNQLFGIIKNRLKSNERPIESLYVSGNHPDILGKAFDFNSHGSIASEDLKFAVDNENLLEDVELESSLLKNEHPVANTSVLVNPEGFIREFKDNLSILKEAEGTKEEFASLFINTASKYPALNNPSQLQTINLFIQELMSTQELRFEISAEELGEYWEESFQIASSVNQ